MPVKIVPSSLLPDPNSRRSDHVYPASELFKCAPDGTFQEVWEACRDPLLLLHNMHEFNIDGTPEDRFGIMLRAVELYAMAPCVFNQRQMLIDIAKCVREYKAKNTAALRDELAATQAKLLTFKSHKLASHLIDVAFSDSVFGANYDHIRHALGFVVSDCESTLDICNHLRQIAKKGVTTVTV